MGAIIIPDTGLQVIASDRVVYSNPTERSGTTTDFFTYNFMIPFVGSIRIKFEAKVASGNFYAHLYYLMFVDASQYLETITNTSGTEYRTIIKDVPVIPCKLSFKFGPNTDQTAYIRNFQICFTPTKGKLYIGGI